MKLGVEAGKEQWTHSLMLFSGSPLSYQPYCILYIWHPSWKTQISIMVLNQVLWCKNLCLWLSAHWLQERKWNSYLVLKLGRSIYHTIIPVWFLAREVPRGYQIPNVRGTRFIPVLFMLQQWHIFVRHQMCHMVIDCCFAKLAISPNIVLCRVWQALSWGINYSSLKLCFLRISQKICLSKVRLSDAKAKNKYC